MDRTRPPLGLAVVAGLIGLGAVVPFGVLVYRASEVRGAAAVLLSAETGRSLVTTLALAAIVTVGGVGGGSLLAWVIERTDVPAPRLMLMLALAPLAVPPYLVAIAGAAAFGPAADVVAIPGSTGFWGAAAVLTLGAVPIVILVVRRALASLDPEVEDAARTLGDRGPQLLMWAVLPQMRRPLATGAMLAALLAIGDVGVVSIMRVETLGLAVFEQQRAIHRAPVSLLALVLVALGAVIVLWFGMVGGRTPTTDELGTGPADRGVAAPRLRLGIARVPALMAVLALFTFGAAGPVLMMATWTSRREPGVDGDLLVTAATTTLVVAVVAALVAVVLALAVVAFALSDRSAYARTVTSLAAVGHVLPGAAVAAALVVLAARWTPAMYQTVPLLIAALVLRFLPSSIAPLRGTLGQVDPLLNDVSRTLGHAGGSRVRRLTLPFARAGMLAGGAAIFLSASRELAATLVLRPAGFDALPLQVWTAAGEAWHSQLGANGLVIVALSALALVPLAILRAPTRLLP